MSPRHDLSVDFPVLLWPAMAHLGQGCLGVLDGHSGVVADGGGDGDGLPRDIATPVQGHSTQHGAGAHAAHAQLMLDLTTEWLLQVKTIITMVSKRSGIRLGPNLRIWRGKGHGKALAETIGGNSNPHPSGSEEGILPDTPPGRLNYGTDEIREHDVCGI